MTVGASNGGAPPTMVARRQTGVAADGEALYECLRCQRHKRRSEYRYDEHGVVNDLCTTCEERVGVTNMRRRYYKDRGHITVEQKVCRLCKQEKGSDNYWLDGKEPDGLKAVCSACELQRRRRKKGETVPVFDAFTPASQVQPIIDAAIAERDALAEEVAALRAHFARPDAQATAPTSQHREAPLEAELWERLHEFDSNLNRLYALTRVLEERHEKAPSLVRRGWQKAAMLVGPVAYAVWKWADGTVVAEGSDQ